ncbi:MAG: NUDIX domain-containing protein [Bacteroidota bacterium]|nr:NUDIX hydrolase [Candidatus Kapabacteria bacterium]MDW8220577.1 NUDIX domain-containing protein [Bacteroidota bacterium]
MSYTYPQPRPAVAVDCVIFGYDHRQHMPELQILCIQRSIEPFRGQWALPGGFLRLHETLDQAAARELHEETGLESVYIEQLYTFSALDRDPRERVISVAYFALVNLERYTLHAGTDAAQAAWFSVAKLPALAFDHKMIVKVALERLRGKIRYQPIGFELLPDEFTLSELQTLYETILERSFDKRNFRKKIHDYGLLIETGGMRRGKPHRAARLYRFDTKRYKALEKRGFMFEL